MKRWAIRKWKGSCFAWNVFEKKAREVDNGLPVISWQESYDLLMIMRELQLAKPRKDEAESVRRGDNLVARPRDSVSVVHGGDRSI